MLGLAIGVVAGVFQFWLLTKFTAGVTSGSVNISHVLLGLVQFFLPLGVLVGVAFLRQQDLIWTASGIAGALMIGAVLKYVVFTRKTRGRGNNND
jgi:hypothetical protein